MTRKSTILLILLLVTVPACTDNDLETAAISLRTTAQAVSVLQAVAIEAHSTNLLSEDVTRRIMGTTIRINEAGLVATGITRDINRLTPEARGQLTSILAPLVNAVDNAIAQDLILVTDPDTKQRMQALLLTIKSSLTAAQIAVSIK